MQRLERLATVLLLAARTASALVSSGIYRHTRKPM